MSTWSVNMSNCKDVPKTASSWYEAKIIIVISNNISVFLFHVLTLYHESHFTFVKFASLSLNFLVKAGAENFTILRAEGDAQNLLKYATTPKSLNFKVLAFYPFFTHAAAHGLTVVFGIRGGFGIANCILV